MSTTLAENCAKILLTAAWIVAAVCNESPSPTSHPKHVWVAQIDSGDRAAQLVAEAHGLKSDGPIPYLKNKYVFRLPSRGHSAHSVSSRVQRSVPEQLHHHVTHRRLAEHPEVSWLSYQTEQKRSKRDLIDWNDVPGRPPVPSDWLFSGFHLPASGPRFSPDAVSKEADGSEAASRAFVDPFWPRQWYLHDTRSSPGQPRLDLSVMSAWRRNITGRGVVVAVVDDGLESDHPDLNGNYDPAASFDYIRGVRDPKPEYYNFEKQKNDVRTGGWHGTRCAGEIAMLANNTFCGVGVAFNAHVGGVKILGDAATNDLTEARGLTHALDRVHVYSSSWGPDDDGETYGAPGLLVREALRAGVELGRGGRGAIYVWAAGNGGAAGDNCNCDGYAASVFTLTVGSVSQSLRSPWYAEPCPATMAVSFSSGSDGEQQMVSTDLRHQCAMDFSGTSAAAPVAAGIAALTLEANPELTWRDLQHAIVWTSESGPIHRRGNGAGWRVNAAGHRYHHRFGFGLFNVGGLLDLVRPAAWRSVPDKSVAELDGWGCRTGRRLSQSEPVKCELDGSRESTKGIRFLEHVQLKVSLSYTERGALAIYLTSGADSRSQLLTRRWLDESDASLQDWDFMTVHFWGESPLGKWRLEIEDQSGNRHNQGLVKDLRLILHGTAAMPHHRARAGGRRRNES